MAIEVTLTVDEQKPRGTNQVTQVHLEKRPLICSRPQ